MGEAAAFAFAQLGASVAVAARRRDRLDALTKRIADAGGEAYAIESDLCDGSQADAAIAQTVERFGRLDTLVNNAGVMLLGAIVDADVGEWQQMLDLNVNALLRCTHAALPHLLK
ncbi:MAG: SDR family NAD(P)-dependent oxidoreductase, partial [Vulcanimicrobiaceae bacterium]